MSANIIISPYPSGGGVSLPVTDTFTRADNASSLGVADTGHAWTTHAGTMGINGNRAYCPTLGSIGTFTGSIATVETGEADVTIDITMPTARSAISFDGIIFRYSDNNNFLLARYSWQNVRVQFDTMVGGSFFSAVDSTGISPPQAHDGMVMKLVLNGSSLELFIDSVSYIVRTDTFNQTATRHGIVVGNSVDTTNSRLDDLSIVAT